MLIHVTSTYRDLDETMPYLEAIRDLVHQSGGSLARDWIDIAKNKMQNEELLRSEDWSYVVANTVDAIKRSDAIIVEGTGYGFLDGFQVAKALELGKPTLFVARFNISKWSVSGVKGDLLECYEYSSKSELIGRIKEFIDVIAQSKAKVVVPIDLTTFRYLRSRAINDDSISTELSKLLDEACQKIDLSNNDDIIEL